MEGYAYNFSIFFFNDTATTEIYTLSLHAALPICQSPVLLQHRLGQLRRTPPRSLVVEVRSLGGDRAPARTRSEEHTSELQSRQYLVCRLLLEKKNKTISFLPSYIMYYTSPHRPSL